jgi:hypothetical protein
MLKVLLTMKRHPREGGNLYHLRFVISLIEGAMGPRLREDDGLEGGG